MGRVRLELRGEPAVAHLAPRGDQHGLGAASGRGWNSHEFRYDAMAFRGVGFQPVELPDCSQTK
jgi:hypothetical protein